MLIPRNSPYICFLKFAVRQEILSLGQRVFLAVMRWGQLPSYLKTGTVTFVEITYILISNVVTKFGEDLSERGCG